jgi:hypothetical protein
MYIKVESPFTMWNYHSEPNSSHIDTAFSTEYRLRKWDKNNPDYAVTEASHIRLNHEDYYLERIGLRKDLSIGPIYNPVAVTINSKSMLHIEIERSK